MKFPTQLRPALWGAACGALLILVLGFTWFGWVGPETVEKRAELRAEAAVVAPICVEKFRTAPDAAENFAALKPIDYSWKKGPFIEKGGWATFAGGKEPRSDVARACTEIVEQQGLPEVTPAATGSSKADETNRP